MTERIKENWWGTALGNGYTYGCLSDARRAAWKYLRSVGDEFTGEAGAHLSRAADCYERIDKTLVTERTDVPRPWFLMPWDLKEAVNWTEEMRHGQAEVLSEIREIEREGLMAIESALEAADRSNPERDAGV